MGFLDNSGDIILDAVLTDTGRQRLARGDGSFKIAKFAFGDDEINYNNYNKDHASGSAYYDLDILQTPVFEAFTNNTSLMRSKLVTISRTNLLYLPILKLNTNYSISSQHASGTFIVTVDEDTEKSVAAGGVYTGGSGILKGYAVNDGDTYIRMDQGLDTSALSPESALDSDLVERQYIIEMDNRLGSLTDVDGNKQAVSFVDDDNVASYYLSLGSSPTLVKEIVNTNTTANDPLQTIAGPRGTYLRIAVKSSVDLQTSTYLFEQLGSTTTALGAVPLYHIDTTIRITGATTGYRIDVPIRYVKKQ